MVKRCLKFHGRDQKKRGLEDRYFSRCRRKILGLPRGGSAVEGKWLKRPSNSYRFAKMCNADTIYSYSAICFLVSILFCIICCELQLS